MKSLHELLDVAEAQWRDEVAIAHPLWGDTQILRSKKGATGRDWEFSTDLKKIYALINNDENLRKRFTSVVTKYWTGKPEAIAKDVLHYLLWHELYHPLEAPFSVTGDPNDNKRIHQAIRRGIIAAQPDLSSLDQLMKVSAAQNGVKDFILDNRFALENLTAHYVRDDIIPVWDLLELDGQKAKTNFYTITRFLYGALYGPESTHAFFAEKSGDKGTGIAGKALEALLKEPVPLPTPSTGLLAKAKAIFSSPNSPASMTPLLGKIRSVFAGDDRYAGIERLMTVLGPYVEQGMPQGRPDQQGEGSGSSPQDILQDLLDDMTPEEQQAFAQNLAQEMSDDAPSKPRSSWTVSNEERNTLELSAVHEFYKRTHPRVTILGGQQVGESVVVGKREQYRLAKSNVIDKDALARLNLDMIARFQKKTRLPMLIPLEHGLYRLNEYTLHSQDIKDIRYVDAQLHAPEHIRLYVDSSGSMYGGNTMGFNDGSRFDMVSNVVYGLVDAAAQTGRKLKQRVDVQVYNVANHQVASRIVSVDEFLQGSTDVLQVLFKPANGYNVEDLDLQMRTNGRTAHIVVTDGDLVITGRTERESQKMRQLAQNPNNTVVLFEIGGTYGLGNAVKGDANIKYYPVHNKEQMLQHGLKVLLR